MQHLISRIPDEQLIDIFVLIEDKHELLAIEYLIYHTHFSPQDANLCVQYLVKQRHDALKRYINEDRMFSSDIPHRHDLKIEAEDDFPDEFILNLNLHDSALSSELSASKQSPHGKWYKRTSVMIYGVIVVMMLSLSSWLYLY